MKKLKIWSMMMLMVMALPLMVACGGDDDTSGDYNKRNSSTGKKLVSIITNGIYEYPVIKYDANGRVIRIEETYYMPRREDPQYGIDSIYYDISYDGNIMNVYRSKTSLQNAGKPYYVDHELYAKYLLNERGNISKKLLADGSETQFQFVYDNDGYLSEYIGLNEVNVALAKSRKFVSSDGNFLNTTTFNFKKRDYTYQSEENKAGIILNDIMYAPHNVTAQIEDFSFDEFIRHGIPTILFHAGLLGKTNKNVVSESSYDKYKSKFTYAFDKDGYPTYIEALSKTYGGTKTYQFFMKYE